MHVQMLDTSQDDATRALNLVSRLSEMSIECNRLRLSLQSKAVIVSAAQPNEALACLKAAQSCGEIASILFRSASNVYKSVKI